MKQFLPSIVVSCCMLLPVLGCRHKQQPKPQIPPLQAQAPPLPDTVTHTLPVEIIPLEPKKPAATVTAAAPPPEEAPPPPPKPEKHHKSVTTKTQPPPAAAPQSTPPPAPVTTAAAPSPITTASPIGQLTEGDISGAAQVQEDTQKIIQSTERGLADLHRALNAQEQETAKQIKKFLQQSRETLAAGDAGGAHTLAVKASLLLEELQK